MDASDSKQSRVTNTAIQSQLVELSVRLARMEKDIQEIKNNLSESGDKVISLEKSEAGRYPLIDRRLDNLEKRTDKHEDEIDQLVKITQSLANTNKVLTWVTGLAGGGVIAWLVTQILSLIGG
jgi:predicted RNase H-like nuclease (RuvC/YqgF family)